MEASGPPSVVVVKATALPFSSSTRQTKKTKAWESYTLSGIANQVAGQNGLKCMYVLHQPQLRPRRAEQAERYQAAGAAVQGRRCEGVIIRLKTDVFNLPSFVLRHEAPQFCLAKPQNF